MRQIGDHYKFIFITPFQFLYVSDGFLILSLNRSWNFIIRIRNRIEMCPWPLDGAQLI